VLSPPQVQQREVEHLPQPVQQVLLHHLRLARRQVVHSARLVHCHHLEDLMIPLGSQVVHLDLALAKVPPLLLGAPWLEEVHGSP
jgi:hypothetical protein